MDESKIEITSIDKELEPITGMTRYNIMFIYQGEIGYIKTWFSQSIIDDPYIDTNKIIKRNIIDWIKDNPPPNKSSGIPED